MRSGLWSSVGERSWPRWAAERLAEAIDAAAAAASPVRMSFDDARLLVAEVLAPDGELARRKVFSRRHVVVELAPHLYGQGPKSLDVLADRALADPEAVPIIGVAGARERVYSLANVLAHEHALAEGLDRQLARTDAPAVGPAVAAVALGRAETELGGGLSEGQRAAAEGICTSGRGADLVVGVAGSGKTTMLRVVADAFERSGYQVLGTATSGQAAHTLGTEAGIAEARTLASLTWRLDHHRLQLAERSVVTLDEVGLTGDADLLRLVAHVEAVGAKLVLVGDDRQLGAVGPGELLGALVARHPGAVHTLSENRRQADPDERKVLAELRAGNVEEAVGWYVESQRVHAISERESALQAAVDAWAADVGAGKETGLYAWRRANVAELNARARRWMEESDRLRVPELVLPDGARYRAGDQVVALTPGADDALVTSERATVEAARGLRDARAELRNTEQAATGPRRRDRRAASKRLPVMVARANDAARQWDAVVVPELGRLDDEVARQEPVVAQLSTVVQRHRAASEAGDRRRLDIERTSGLFDTVLSAYRDQLDGVAQPAATRVGAHPALLQLRPEPAYGPVTEAERGPSL